MGNPLDNSLIMRLKLPLNLSIEQKKIEGEPVFYRWAPAVLPALLLLFSLPVILPDPAYAESLLEMDNNGKSLSIASFDVEDDWDEVDAANHHELVARLVDYGVGQDKADYLSDLAEVLKKKSDPYLKSYGLIAGIYRNKNAHHERLAGIREALVQSKDPVERRILEFHEAMENNQIRGSYIDPAILKSCTLVGMNKSCKLAKAVQLVYRYTRYPRLKKEDYQAILAEIQPLTDPESGFFPPFTFSIASTLPDMLVQLGLPLEAAQVALNITANQENREVVALRSRIPFYYGAAGDFAKANAIAASFDDGQNPILLNMRMDWMILSQDYKDAIALLSRVGTDHLGGTAMQGMSDYWTGLPYSPGIVGMKLAILLYMAGDVKSAGTALEKLSDIKGETGEREPLKLYARLRMAQILMETNPSLAYRIAEDLTYLAQASGWTLLEYRATVMMGWASYFRKDYYGAMIAFVKARGIFRTVAARGASSFSQDMGMLATYIGVNRRGKYIALIRKLHTELVQRPYNRSIYTMNFYVPSSVDPAFFLDLIRTNRRGHRYRHDPIDPIAEYHEKKRAHTPQPGKNPGGYAGLPESIYWIQEMKRFPYVNSRNGGIQIPAVIAAAAKESSLIESRSLK